MSRLPVPTLREAGPLAWGFARLSGRVTGTEPPLLFLTIGRQHALFRGWLHFAGKLMPGGRIPRRESELIILRVATAFSPLRVFLPASLLAFGIGAGFYAWHWIDGSFPKISGGVQSMWLLGAILFAIGLLSEQVASLRFDRSEED